MSISLAKEQAKDADLSPVQEFYRDAVILITGATGFLGKLLLEKLLRSCPCISRVLVLIRNKKETSSQQRLTDIMEDMIMQGLSTESRMKVSVVSGDCGMPGLGLSKADTQILLDSVTVVFHVAATVRFDEDLTTAVAVNVVGTSALLQLAQRMPRLKAFVHVSTAFSQCHVDKIEEKFYPPLCTPETLTRLTETLDRPLLNLLTPLLLKDRPNTYIYTKSVAEDLVYTYSKCLPVAVFRPSIVVSTAREPVAGWINNTYGPTCAIVACVSGLLRFMHADPDVISDVVPADMVVNALIVTAWRIHDSQWDKDGQGQVFNFVSSPESPLKASRFIDMCLKYHVPSIHAVWYPSLQLCRSRMAYQVLHILYHLLPALMVDASTRVIGKPSNLVKISMKLEKFGQLMSFFTTHEWEFSNNNIQTMWFKLSPADQLLFPFSFQQYDWEIYFKSYMSGIRQYHLKDDPATLPQAVARMNRLFWMHHFLRALLLYLTIILVWNLVD